MQTQTSEASKIKLAITAQLVGAIASKIVDQTGAEDADLMALLGPMFVNTIDELAEDAYQCDCGRWAHPRFSHDGRCLGCMGAE